MTNPLDTLLKAVTLPASRGFPAESRYHDAGTASLVLPDGRRVAFLQRRFVPPPEVFATLLEHTVVQGDRLDNLTARYLGDAEQFWRICDANGTLRPEALTETTGRRIRIALPQGIPGNPNA